jgi:hypothetical protein
MKDKPIIVCLCGSTRFKDVFERTNKEETLKGNIVLSVGMFGHVDAVGNVVEKIWLTDEQKVMLDRLHLRKIDLSDEVLILNVGGYIGESTKRELLYAKEKNKKIRFLE